MDIEYLHLFVKNAANWRDWFIEKLDFQPISLDIVKGFAELAIRRGRIWILISSAETGLPAVNQYLQRHPEGVGEVAFRVRDLDAIAARLHTVGETLLAPIQERVTPVGSYRWCRIQGWGSLQHTLIERPDEVGKKYHPPAANVTTIPWLRIDHAVLNVPVGDLEQAATWYETRLGFVRQQRFVIETPRSGLRSVVLKHPEGTATLPVNEPTSPNSQIQEFLDHHRGPGIQHVALQTKDLVHTIAILRERGVSFLSVPMSYYEQLRERDGFWQEASDWEAIAQQQILVDWTPEEPQTRLLQTFTRPLFEQPTFFWEFIERQSKITQAGTKCVEGFGEGNFQALFEAIEREQQQRGSLD